MVSVVFPARSRDIDRGTDRDKGEDEEEGWRGGSLVSWWRRIVSTASLRLVTVEGGGSVEAGLGELARGKKGNGDGELGAEEECQVGHSGPGDCPRISITEPTEISNGGAYRKNDRLGN